MTSMLLLALHFWLLDYNYDPSDFEWLVVSSLMMFSMMCLGLTLVPSTMLSELFPSDLKSIAGFFGSVTSAVFAFIATKTYQPLRDVMNEQYIFCIYAVIMAFSLVYSILQVPETKGKTLQVNTPSVIAFRRCVNNRPNVISAHSRQLISRDPDCVHLRNLDHYPGFGT